MIDWHYPAAFAIAYLIGWLLSRVCEKQGD
jgi:hypothetical protein